MSEGLLPAPSSPLRGIPVAEQTLPKLLERQAAAYGEKPLLRMEGGRELSFTAVRDRAKAAAATLQRAGIEPGDRVLLLAENRLELLEIVLGCAWLGAVVVPVNTALRGEQLQHVLDNSQPRLIAVEPALLEPLQGATPPPSLERVWLFDDGAEAPERVLGVDCEPFPELAGEPAPAATEIGPGTLVAILYTSGTTGPSKGVCCPQAQFYWWGVTVGELLEIGEDDVLYTCLPMFHTNALNAFVQALVAGATFVIGERFSASRFWQRAAAEGATVTYLLGAMVNILHGRPPAPEDSAHAVRIALAPATPATLHEPFRAALRSAADRGLRLDRDQLHDRRRARAPAARLDGASSWPTTRSTWSTRTTRRCRPGEAGELVLRPRHPFSFATGYFANPRRRRSRPGATSGSTPATGCCATRTAGSASSTASRTRSAAAARTSPPSRSRRRSLSHPQVAGVAVFAVPSEMAEDEVMAAVVPKPGEAIEPDGADPPLRGPRSPTSRSPATSTSSRSCRRPRTARSARRCCASAAVTATTWDREAAGVVLKR